MLELNNLFEVSQHIDDLKVILFDMDDTLYSEKEYVFSGYQQIAKKFPQIKDMSDQLWQAFLAKKPAIDEVLAQNNLLTPKNKELCLQTYRFQKPTIHLYPEAKQLLESLKAKNFKLGLITDGRIEGQSAKIEALGLAKYFDKILITDALGGINFRKPNPLAFEKMQQYFGYRFEQMCYIGDNLNKDFIAPSKLKMRCIYFKNKDSLYYKK